MASAPSVVIGRAEGEEHETLSSISGAVRLADGSIVVGDGGAHRIRIYNATGRHVASFGGFGEGPGEFGVMGLLGRVSGDSIAVWDLRRKRMTMFSRDGQPRTSPTVTVRGILVPAISWLGNGSVVVAASITLEDALSASAGETRRQTDFVLINPDGSAHPVLSLPGREVVVRRSGRSYIPEPVLFGRNSHVAATARELVYGDSEVFELRRRSWDGRLRMIIRKQGRARPVTTVELEAAEAEAREKLHHRLGLAARVAGGAVPRSTGAAQLPHRRTHPYFDDLKLDDTGHVWTRESAVGVESRSWLVFDPDGIWLGSVLVPARLRVTDIGRDYVLGIYSDELDVESVRLYRVERRN